MVTIVPRTSKDGTTTYLVRVRRKGTPPQTATFPTLKDAQKWVHVIEGGVIEGRHFPTTEAKRHTVGDLIERYVRTVLPTRSTSHATMQRQQLRWWNAHIGHYALHHITPALIVEHRDILQVSFGPATVTRYLAALSYAFTVAVREWQWCTENPVRKVTRPREPQGRVRFLSDEERDSLLDACRTSRNPYLYTIVVLALSTGARKMELLSLTWKDVDLSRGIITLHDTKNGTRRVLHLTGIALNRLQDHGKVRRLDTALVFPNDTGTKYRSLSMAWVYALRRARVSDFRFHDRRHSAASYLAMSGASLIDIAHILGHKSLQVTQRYAHLSEDHTHGVVEKMNRAIFGA